MNKLFLVGDSTVCYYDLKKEDLEFLYPRNGYGMWLQQRFEDIEVVNLALSGRSSKSFLLEDNYKILCDSLSEGDYLSISFGHNDEKFKDVTRFTFGAGETSDACSFKYSLYENYIKLAISKKATPILCTPIVRRSPENAYVGDRVHSIGEVECDGKIYPASDYAQAIRELAKEKNVALIDMTALTKEYYQIIGADESATLHATTSKNKEDVDNTHLNSFGAHLIADIYVDGLLDTKCSLKNFAVCDKNPPDEEDLIVNKF